MAGMPLIRRERRSVFALHGGTWPWALHASEDTRKPVLFLTGEVAEPVLLAVDRAPPELLSIAPGTPGTLEFESTDHAEVTPAALRFEPSGGPRARPDDLRGRPGVAWILLARALAPASPRLVADVRYARERGELDDFDEAYALRLLGAVDALRAAPGAPAAWEYLTFVWDAKSWPEVSALFADRRDLLEARAFEIHNDRDTRHRSPLLPPSGKPERGPGVRMSWTGLLEAAALHAQGRLDEAQAAWARFRKAFPRWRKAVFFGSLEGFAPPLRELWKPDRPQALLERSGAFWEGLQ